MVNWDRVKSIFDQVDIDCFILLPSGVSSFREYNFRWLTDVDQPVTCSTLFYPDHCQIIAYEMEKPYLQKTLGQDKKVEITTDPSIIKDIAGKVVGISYSNIPSLDKDELDKKLEFTKQTVPMDKFFYKSRLVKDQKELGRIRVSSWIANNVMRDTIEILKYAPRIELTETDLAGIISNLLREKISYFDRKIYSEKPTVLRVASGCNTSLFHPEPTLKIINHNELVSVDIDAVYKGYHYFEIDTIFTGALTKKRANNGQKKAYELAADALNTAADMMCAGEKGSRVYKKVEKILSKFPHFYFNGSPIGLEIHEPTTPNRNWIYPSGREPLEKNSVYNLFAGIFKPGKWGVKMTYTVKVGSNKGVRY